MFDLTGKVALVTGGGGGLGEYCAAALAAQGARVIIASRGLDKLKAVAAGIKARNGKDIDVMTVDVTDENSVIKLAEQVIQKYKTIDILVNAHGVNAKMQPAEIDFAKWDNMFTLNVKGTMITCKTIGKIMVGQKKGKIINLSSTRGARGTDGGNVTYGATKGAVDMITKMLAAEWARFNVNVNALAPSVVLTENFKKSVTPERMQLLLSKTLFGRFATTDEVAAACVYLAAPESDYTTGAIMYVDGGLTAVG